MQIWKSKIKSKSIFQKILRIDYDYVVQLMTDKPLLGFWPNHYWVFYHWPVWFSAAFNDLGGQKVSLDVDVNVI